MRHISRSTGHVGLKALSRQLSYTTIVSVASGTGCCTLAIPLLGLGTGSGVGGPALGARDRLWSWGTGSGVGGPERRVRIRTPTSPASAEGRTTMLSTGVSAPILSTAPHSTRPDRNQQSNRSTVSQSRNTTAQEADGAGDRLGCHHARARAVASKPISRGAGPFDISWECISVNTCTSGEVHI